MNKRALGLAFILNLLWEFWHSQFYTSVLGHSVSWPFLVTASFLDVLLVWLIIFVAEKIYKSYLIVIFLGFLAAVFNEKMALWFHLWQYNSKMAIVPLLKIGLTPVLQMTLLPFFIYLFENKFKTPPK